jgi:glycerol-3-phosphate acyltransferase PlsY
VLGTVLRILAVVAIGYLFGGVPFGAIVARTVYHVDITTLGSGNTGATNVLRNLGWKAALPVALLDIAKGAGPALLALALADPEWGVNGRDMFVVVAGVAAVIGHVYSPYFRLRGGKGIATAGGALIVLMPAAFGVVTAVFVAVALLGRIASVASIAAALSLPVAIVALYPGRPVLLVFALAVVPLILWAHRANIGRLMRGEEPRITMDRVGGGGDGRTGESPE